MSIVPGRKTTLPLPLFQIRGSLPHLHEVLASEIQARYPNKRVISIKRYSSDLERYLNSLEILDKKVTYAGLEFTLEEKNFNYTLKLESMGEYSRSGDVISFWPIGYSKPIRVEFFDDEVEKIYEYDELYGTKLRDIDHFIVGDIDILDDRVEWGNFVLNEWVEKKPDIIFLKKELQLETSSNYICVVFTNEELGLSTIDLNLIYPPLYYGRLDIAKHQLERQEQDGFSIFLESQHEEGLDNYFKSKLTKSPMELSAGFVDQKGKVIYLTDREIFGTIFLKREKQKKLSSRQAKKLLNELEGEVEIGDYLVHEDHGIGIYAGITREKESDYLLLKYAEGDELLIPFDQIHKITKYIGISNEEPVVTRLSKMDWQQVTAKTKKQITLIAKDLVRHYAQLELAKARPVDQAVSAKYDQFVAAFPYEETEDQTRTIEQVLNDMNSQNPMNRLIVGDVGFGKTEVAMRAAFKAVENGMQVAVLVPTTVLALQHYKVFKDRFNRFGIKVAMLSRFSGTKLNKEHVEAIKRGALDIVVGTHRLLGNDIQFKNLGLVIIDEEQRFGVKQKEKLRKLQYGAHTLSMTATPIPRTLSMALSEIQDISIISIPPKGRKSVETYVQKIDWNKVRSVLHFEVERGGQAYFLHNNIETIQSIKDRLENLLPDVKFAIGHGRMNEKDLERVINDFYERKYDVLISTTIIENGIDMPNVNTIIINKAQNFGLGQLYQLRGRVGRSEKQAYAYLFYDGRGLDEKPEEQEDETQVKKAPKKYVERLKAIMESQELGAGFKIASRDLEIRGAGNLLGKQQHGNISKVGLGLYMQMLAEEIERLRLEATSLSSPQ